MKTITLLSIFLFLLLLPQTKAEQKDPSQQPQLSKPVVFRLEGKATTTVKKTDTPMALKKGDALEIGSQVHTEINSRMVLAFGDGHHIRFDELTTAELTAQPLNKKKKSTTLHAITGNVWISIPKVAALKSPVSILTTHAFIQSNQGIFRLSIFPDNSVQVKVYRGIVNIKKKKNSARKGNANRTSKMWTHILKPMQQIFIRKNGTPTNPFQFMLKPDRNTWVLWNEALDKELLAAQ